MAKCSRMTSKLLIHTVLVLLMPSYFSVDILRNFTMVLLPNLFIQNFFSELFIENSLCVQYFTIDVAGNSIMFECEALLVIDSSYLLNF